MYHESDHLCPGGTGYIPEGSIQLTIRQGGTAVPGGSFTLYQVGALQEEDGNYRFVLTEAFAGSKVSLEEVSSAQLANTLAAYAKDHKLSGTAKDVDKDGEIAFTGLELGLYLLVQHKAAKGYETAAPFLVSVPMEEDGVLRYDVDASPKVELEKEPEPTSTTPPCTHRPPPALYRPAELAGAGSDGAGTGPACAGLGAAEEEPPWVRPGTCVCY